MILNYLLSAIADLQQPNAALLLAAVLGLGVATGATLSVASGKPSLFNLTKRAASLKASQTEERQKAFFKELPDAIFVVDAVTLRTVDCNPRAVELFEADTQQDLVNHPEHTLLHLQRQPFTAAELSSIAAELKQAGVWRQELEYRTLKGQSFWGSLAAKQVCLAGKQFNLVRIIDITARKQAEAQMRLSLQEKELLLQETHHRTKNNLHIIANLLDLQSEQVADQQLLKILADSQNRIQTMALIHQQLYQSQSYSKVEFSEYLYRLIDNLSFAYGSQLQSIQPVLEADPIQINQETATPCALLVNELVTNAFKHAFPHGQPGKVRIQLYQEQQYIHLNITDDGVGLAPEIWQNSSSLGLKLVKILAKQLKAKIHFDDERGTSSGTRIHLTFTELQNQRRWGCDDRPD
jgi:PAS domain S-box-containing protein